MEAVIIDKHEKRQDPFREQQNDVGEQTDPTEANEKGDEEIEQILEIGDGRFCGEFSAFYAQEWRAQ